MATRDENSRSSITEVDNNEQTSQEKNISHSPASSDPNPHEENGEAKKDAPKKNHYGLKVWTIISGLILSAILSALEGSIVSTAMPTITAELNSGQNYTWIIAAYFLTGWVSIPSSGSVYASC